MFRPCIDLHEGRVKQIVGGSLTKDPQTLRTNFVSDRPGSWFAELFKKDDLRDGHVIMLGPGNETAAREALSAFPGGLQVGGGITPSNASGFLAAGASHVIVTSWIFCDGRLARERLRQMSATVGREKLVLDLSCRRREGKYFVVTDRWQKFTDFEITAENLSELAESCAEFLVHAADVEGLRLGMDMELVEKLAQWSPLPTTYAGGANSLRDLEEVWRIGRGKIYLTIGSALDIFGGTGVRYADAVAFNRRHRPAG